MGNCDVDFSASSETGYDYGRNKDFRGANPAQKAFGVFVFRKMDRGLEASRRESPSGAAATPFNGPHHRLPASDHSVSKPSRSSPKALPEIGALSPLATLVLVLLTLFGALPIYRRVAQESPRAKAQSLCWSTCLPGGTMFSAVRATWLP
jgi:hypothetical protein